VNENFGENVENLIEKGVINREQIFKLNREGKTNTLTRQQRREAERTVITQFEKELMRVDLVTLPVLEKILDQFVAEMERVLNKQVEELCSMYLGTETLFQLLIDRGITDMDSIKDTSKKVAERLAKEQKSEEEESNDNDNK
jgi:hypothetical protein